MTVSPLPFVVVLLAIVIAIVVGLAFRPKFRPRPILNKSEIRLYRAVEARLPRGFRLLAQVSYGEMLGNKSRGRYMTINAKRADLVICDDAFNPVAVIEYQGGGHYGRTLTSNLDTRRRDRQKRAALAEAGIALIEVEARYCVDEVAARVTSAIQKVRERTHGARVA